MSSCFASVPAAPSAPFGPALPRIGLKGLFQYQNGYFASCSA
jgi:hypothetical protein